MQVRLMSFSLRRSLSLNVTNFLDDIELLLFRSALDILIKMHVFMLQFYIQTKFVDCLKVNEVLTETKSQNYKQIPEV